MVDVTPKAVTKNPGSLPPRTASRAVYVWAFWAAGCSGLSYQFQSLIRSRGHQQRVYEFDGVQVYMTQEFVFLDGMTLDWHDSLIQSGFVFENPHARRNCGCGIRFPA